MLHLSILSQMHQKIQLFDTQWVSLFGYTKGQYNVRSVSCTLKPFYPQRFAFFINIIIPTISFFSFEIASSVEKQLEIIFLRRSKIDATLFRSSLLDTISSVLACFFQTIGSSLIHFHFSGTTSLGIRHIPT